jgi:hypothetical protein
MITYAFMNCSQEEIEVYDTGDFDSLTLAIEHAKTLADEMDTDVEIWSYDFTVHPYTAYMESGDHYDDQWAISDRDRAIDGDLEQLLQLRREQC